jgi:hypothetical protein
VLFENVDHAGIAAEEFWQSDEATLEQSGLTAAQAQNIQMH